LNLLSLAQEVFDLGEAITQVSDAGAFHVIHCSITRPGGSNHVGYEGD